MKTDSARAQENQIESASSMSAGISIGVKNALLVLAVHVLVVSLSYIPGWRGLPLLESLQVGDQSTYQAAADSIVKFGSFSREETAPRLWEPYRTPGLPLMIALSSVISGGPLLVPFMTAVLAALAAYCGTALMAMLGASKVAQRCFGYLLAFHANALGIGCYLLVDSLLGYTLLVWAFLMIRGLLTENRLLLVTSVVPLAFGQLLKPTLAFGPVFIVVVASAFRFHGRRNHLVLALCIVAAGVAPLYLASQNKKDHGVLTVSLLGETTIREYLMAAHLAKGANVEFDEMQRRIRAEDRAEAAALSSGLSPYAKLYGVQRRKNIELWKADPAGVMLTAATEAFRQLLAPQEIILRVFMPNVPSVVRAVGAALSILGFAMIVVGAWYAGSKLMRGYAAIVLMSFAFFLALGSLSAKQGARLRLPADILGLPVLAVGICHLGSKLRERRLPASRPGSLP